MDRNYVNLTVNPCKMCMPMGMVAALKGISGSMVILHGSQGCSTYIRRHMATHYNEPVDIASSSLTEQGTVFGGSENLKKAIYNVIGLYEPSVIGIGTTCLAETIGEDTARMVKEMKTDPSLKSISLIPISTPGYAGTQFEGYFNALKAIVEDTAVITGKSRALNVIVPLLSPADIRHLKLILEMFGIEYIMLPDISDTLDAPYTREYKRIPKGGTALSSIARMPGAMATLEIGTTIPEKLSPGKFLKDKFGVPLYRCPLPMGIEGTDTLISLLAEFSGRKVPHMITEQRGRLMDSMIDSHKYNSEFSAAVYGEPELVLGILNICLENGIGLRLAATGCKSPLLKPAVENLEEKFKNNLSVMTDTDFEKIQKFVAGCHVDVLIGNSDGKWIEEKEGIPLVRIGFPIHDRIGGQRLLSICYEGTMRLLDEITNTYLSFKESTYRKRMYQKYFN